MSDQSTQVTPEASPADASGAAAAPAPVVDAASVIAELPVTDQQLYRN